LVVGGVLLFSQPIANENLHIPGTNEVLTVGCSSPFEQFQGNVLRGDSRLQIMAGTTPDTYRPKCESAAGEREHVIEALGGAAVILVVLSFVRRRTLLLGASESRSAVTPGHVLATARQGSPTPQKKGSA